VVDIVEDEEEAAGAIYVDELRVTLPIELSIEVDAQGHIALAATPPSQHLETTVMPVWHTCG